MVIFIFVILLLITLFFLLVWVRGYRYSVVALEEMERDEFDRVFWSIAEANLGVKRDSPDLPLSKIGATPMARIETVEVLSDDFGFEISEDDFEREGTIGELSDWIWGQTQRRLVFRPG